MTHFKKVNQQLEAIESAKKSHRQYLDDLNKEVADVTAQIQTLKDAPIKEVAGKDYNEVLVAQAEKLQFLEEKKAKAENRLALSQNMAVPFPYSAGEVVSAFMEATNEYKEQVVQPLEEQALKLKEQYEAAILALDVAMTAQQGAHHETERVLKHHLKDTTWIPTLRSKPREIFINTEHFREFDR